MRAEREVLTQFDDWAHGNDLVRAAVLTSSRVDPARAIDSLSDYDIEMYVADLRPFQQDDDWLSAFGPVMVRWPHKPLATFDENGITRLVLFKDGVRIDFQITDKTQIESDAYKNGYRVLIDKDNLTSSRDAPTFSEFIVKKPSLQEYETLVHDFWWDATYVPKYLWRDELPMAKFMFDKVIRYSYIQRIVEWYIGAQHDWSVNTGANGRWFKRYLNSETWAELGSTYAGADIEENWTAFFKATELFRKLATAVGSDLGCNYPTDLDEEVTEYCSRIRTMKITDDAYKRLNGTGAPLRGSPAGQPNVRYFDSDHSESENIDREIEYCKKENIPFKALRDGEVLIFQSQNEIDVQQVGQMRASHGLSPDLTIARPFAQSLGGRVNAVQNENSLSDFGISTSELTARGLVKYDEATKLEIAETDENGRNHMLVLQAAVAWRGLRKAAEADNVSIYIVSAYRSISRQVEILHGKLEIGMAISDILKICAPPGYSEHHTGRAVDIGTDGIKPLETEFDTTEAFCWLTKHAGEYGFSLSYPRGNALGYQYEPWHWCHTAVQCTPSDV